MVELQSGISIVAISSSTGLFNILPNVDDFSIPLINIWEFLT